VSLKEEANEMGGYFINNGIERVVRLLQVRVSVRIRVRVRLRPKTNLLVLGLGLGLGLEEEANELRGYFIDN
jgi:hypothetical protein